MGNNIQTEFTDSSITLAEAAKFLGFKSTERLRQKAKLGIIPGAFKIGKCWKFYKPKLVEYVEALYDTYRKTAQVDINGGMLCPSVRKKIAPSITHGLRSAESAYRNLRELLLKQKRKDTKKNGETTFENKCY